MNDNFNNKKIKDLKNKKNNLNTQNKPILNNQNTSNNQNLLLDNNDSTKPISVSSVTVKVIDSKLNTEVSHIDNLISERKKEKEFKK